MGRWARSRQLASASWQVVKQDKELLWLPLISGFASLVIAASFAVPIFVTARHHDIWGNTTMRAGPVQYVLGFAMYLVLAYVTIFFRTALLSAADERMRGGDPTFGSALAGATSRAGRILPWAIVSATVSIVLRQIQERSGIVGRIVVGFVGMAWAVVTFLVLPVIVFEDVGVATAVRRSTEMLKHTWGENLIVNTGIGIIAFLLMLPAFLFAIVGLAVGTVPSAVVGISVAAVWILAVACWSNAMSGVFQVALYRYAIDGAAPGPFGRIDLGQAFAPKAAGRRWRGGGGTSGRGGTWGAGSSTWSPPTSTPGWPSPPPATGWPPPPPPAATGWPPPPPPATPLPPPGPESRSPWPDLPPD
ncbi:MAG: hypothetical protein JWN46_2210 [Acidimicrobiales bacterium]|nr:hypothetical protein [Acidimicrobiales bacterium]